MDNKTARVIFCDCPQINNILPYIYSTLFLVMILVGCKTPAPKGITETEAMKIAEKFVITQGYTDQPTDITMSEAKIEEEEFATSIEKLLQTRAGVLESKAWEARKFKEKTMWAVGFNFTSDEPNVGRCVIMDTLGNDIHMKEGHLRMDWLLDDLPPEEKQKKMDLIFE